MAFPTPQRDFSMASPTDPFEGVGLNPRGTAPPSPAVLFGMDILPRTAPSGPSTVPSGCTLPIGWPSPRTTVPSGCTVVSDCSTSPPSKPMIRAGRGPSLAVGAEYGACGPGVRASAYLTALAASWLLLRSDFLRVAMQESGPTSSMFARPTDRNPAAPDHASLNSGLSFASTG